MSVTRQMRWRAQEKAPVHTFLPLTKYKYWGEAEIPLIKKYNTKEVEMRLIIKYKQKGEKNLTREEGDIFSSRKHR